MDRRDFLKTFGLGAASVAMPRGPFVHNTSAQERPKVILVITDDQGYGDLGCHSNPIIQTPNLDRLHAQSVRLTNFHVDPTCSPTRSALMTGRYSTRTGVWHTIMGRSLLHRDEVTMADVFSASGYRTGIFGKWHLGDNYPFRPQDRGFHEVLVHGGGAIGNTPDFWGNDYFDDTYWHNSKPKKFKGYCTNIWFDGAVRFIEQNKDRPFFVYLTTNAPHGPYNVAEKYSKPYRDKGVPENRARFYGMITNIDENMGRLMKRLKALGLEENTILMFMTDNGTSAGNTAGMRGQKGSEYDGGHRVPFFIRWPAQLAGGRDVQRITAHIDILPTLIDLCGLKKPEEVEFDGTSLAPLLKGDDKGWPDRTLLVHSQRIDHVQKWRKSAVMTDHWRLVNGRELYDMCVDPGQKQNIADVHPAVVDKLRNTYGDWWADISGRFDEYCEIIIGSERETPSRLTSHDWHGPEVPWDQWHVRNGAPTANGFWAVEVARTGKYEFALRRWPVEVDKPINAAIPGGRAISATEARLKIGEVDFTQPVPKDASAVTFRVQLKEGKTRLETWFADEKGESRGAYYVYVKRLP